MVFDTSKRQVVANLDGFRRVHGVTVAPEIHRLYASVTGNHQVAAVDTESLKTVGTAGPINYPDGLAYAPKQNKVFVSDEHGGVDAVLDAANNKLITNIPLGGGAEYRYDSVSGQILVAVHGLNLLAVSTQQRIKLSTAYLLLASETPTEYLLIRLSAKLSSLVKRTIRSPWSILGR